MMQVAMEEEDGCCLTPGSGCLCLRQPRGCTRRSTCTYGDISNLLACWNEGECAHPRGSRNILP